MAAEMPVTYFGISMNWIKCLLCAINLAFMLIGTSMILMSTHMYKMFGKLSYFLESSYVSPANLLITVGVLILIMAFFGICGALKESTCMVLTFAFLLSTVLVLEVAVSVSAYVLRDHIESHLTENINDTMHQYDHDSRAKEAMDSLQNEFWCCGYNRPDNWLGIGSRTNLNDLPKSCFSYCDYYSRCIYKSQGCFKQLARFVNENRVYLISGVALNALSQIVGILLAVTLGRNIRRQKTLKEMRKWQRSTTLPNLNGSFEKTDQIITFSNVHM